MYCCCLSSQVCTCDEANLMMRVCGFGEMGMMAIIKLWVKQSGGEFRKFGGNGG